MKVLSKRLPDWAIQEVREWLQEYCGDIGNKIYSDHRFVAETIFDELLEELKEK